MDPARLQAFPCVADGREEFPEGDATVTLDQEGALFPAVHAGQQFGKGARALPVEQPGMAGVAAGADLITPNFITPWRLHSRRS